MFFKTLSKRTILGCFFSSLLLGLNAQNIERQVISAGTSSLSNGTVTMHVTIGEIASTTIGTGNPQLRQGILQTTSLKYIYSAGSWSPENPVGVSNANDIVIIQNGSTILTGDLITLHLEVDASASLDLNNHTVNLYGDLTNNGAISGSAATIHHKGFQGALAGNAFVLSSLVSGSSSNLTINTDVSILDVVTLNSGIINNQSGKLIFKSDAVKTAMLDEVPAASNIVGNVQVERYYQATRAFRFTSSPVTTTTSINDNWQEGVNNTTLEYSTNQNPNPGYGTHITGSTSGAYGFDITDTGNPSLFTFDNVAQSWNDIPNTNTLQLDAGAPYRLFIRGDRSMNINIDGEASTVTRIRARGTLTIGNYTDNNLSTVAGEFNFIGNPYQASIDLNSVLASSSNLNPNNFYVWDPNLQSGIGAYVTVDLPAGTNTSGSQSNQYLQPFQGAFVRVLANGAASIDFQETHKSVGVNTNVYGISNQNNSLIGQIYKLTNGVAGTYPEDSFGIDFHSTYSNEVDQYDAIKPFNVRENIYIRKATDNLSLEKRDFPIENEEIEIDQLGYSGTNYFYKINVVGLLNYEVFLKDDYLNNLSLLVSGINDVPFMVDDSNPSSAIDRFSLVFQNQTLSSGGIDNSGLTSISLFPNPVSGNDVTLNFNATQINSSNTTYTYKVTTLLGQRVMGDSLMVTNGKAQISGFINMATGVYIIEVFDGDEKVFSTKLLKK
jgi:hypothetical protein